MAEDEPEDGSFKGLMADATRAANGQHTYEMHLVDEFDRLLLEHDTKLRDALRAVMERRAARRGVISESVADVAFNIVGVERPPKVIRDAQARQGIGYDHVVDPYNLYGKGGGK